MALADITQEQVDELTAQRARLQPLAEFVGVTYDEGNYVLMRALVVLADARQLARSAKASTAAGARLQLPAAGRSPVLPRGVASGDAEEPADGLQAALAQPAVVTLGDQICARMAARRLGMEIPSWAFA
jgi:hypothetical protein